MPLWKHDLDHLVFHHTDVYIPSNSLRAQQPAENGLETPLLRHHVLEGRSLAANAENADAADDCVRQRTAAHRRRRLGGSEPTAAGPHAAMTQFLTRIRESNELAGRPIAKCDAAVAAHAAVHDRDQIPRGAPGAQAVPGS